MKHYKSEEFLQFLECQAPCTNVKPPLSNTFWRRFCISVRLVFQVC